MSVRSVLKAGIPVLLTCIAAMRLQAVVLPSNFVLAGQADQAAAEFRATEVYQMPHEHDQHHLVPYSPEHHKPQNLRNDTAVRASDFRTGAYVRTAVGVFMPDDWDAGSLGTDFPNLQLSARTGFRFTAAAGYKFNDWFSLEFETGILYTEIFEVIGDDVADLPTSRQTGKTGSITFGQDDIKDPDYFQVPLMVNAYCHFPTGTRFRPYIGAGIGGIVNWCDLTLNGNPMKGGPRLFDDDADGREISINELDFAYQAMAGLKYMICPGERVDALDPTHPVIEAELGYSWLTNDIGPQNHSILAGMSFLW